MAKAIPVFDPDGSDYDYQTALSRGMGPSKSGKNKGHWGSVTRVEPWLRAKLGLPDESYVMLKGRKHKTWNLAEKEEVKRGFRIIKLAGRYYSVPKDWAPWLK